LLHFETSDGAFREDIPGVITNDSTGSRWFETSLTPDFHGSYDGSRIAQQYGTSDLELSTTFSSSGRLRVNSMQASPTDLAVWPAPLPGQ
jgi:hypothetical protein